LVALGAVGEEGGEKGEKKGVQEKEKMKKDRLEHSSLVADSAPA